MVETQIFKMRGSLNLCFVYDTVFVKYTWLLIHCFTCFYGRSFARVYHWKLPRWTYFCGAVYEAAGLVDVYVKSRSNLVFCSTADQLLLLLMSQVACRPTCVDRGAGAAAAVGTGRTLLDFFKPKSATDGAKESSVLMDISSGVGASGDADVVATGVVNRGEGGAGASSFAEVVATGVVNALPVFSVLLTFRESLD